MTSGHWPLIRSNKRCCPSVIWSTARVTRIAACFGETLSGALGRELFPPFLQGGDKTRDHGAFAQISLFPDLSIQLRRVVTALIPTLLQVFSKVVHLGWPAVRRFPLWKLPAA